MRTRLRVLPGGADRRAGLAAALVVVFGVFGAMLLPACASTASNGSPSQFDSGVTGLTGPDATSTIFTFDSGPNLLGGGDATLLLGDAGYVPPPFTGPLMGPFTDFPVAPVIDSGDAGAGAPAGAAQLFGPATQGAQSGGPCLIEPEVGSLYPNNWLRPRFAWSTANTETLFELRVHADNQTNDLVVYTTATQWTMPEAMWEALRADSQDVPMTVSVRGGLLQGATLTNEAAGSSGSIGIAPVGAPGTVVYWSIINNGQTGLLKGFSIGDESVVQVLSGAQVQERGDAGVPCIGCHAATPDGLNVSFSIGPNDYTNSIGTIGKTGTPGLIPSFLTPDAKTVLDTLTGVAAYSLAHWSASNRTVILSDSGDLHWINLAATGAQVTGIIPLGGTDPTLKATVPSWSHDGKTIAYCALAASEIFDGRPTGGPMDIYTVHYPAGGDAEPLTGAADPVAAEYYPAFSPDDQFVLFNKVSAGGSAYNNSAAELYVVPSAGGTATRLSANDPPTCTQKKSPGVTNSWGKWSPSAQFVPVLGSTYYWVVFSSTRDPGGNPQLYITPVVVDTQGNVTTYHSLYLWNQPANEDNHTPAWDVFQIPPVIQPPPK